MALPSSSVLSIYDEPYVANYLLLDSSVSTVVKRNGMAVVQYDSRNLTMPHDGISRFRLVSFVLTSASFNIVDDSAYPGGLQNNIIVFDGSPVVIPPGNWNSVSLALFLQTEFSLITPGTTVIWSPITLQFSIANAAPVTLDLSGSDSPWWELGFEQQSYGPSILIESTRNYNLSGPVQVFININEIYTQNILSYNLQGFHFVYPLSSRTDFVSQGNLVTLAKTVCHVQCKRRLDDLTVSCWFSRAGQLYPYYSNQSDYQMLLEIS